MPRPSPITAGQAKAQGVTEFLVHIIPTTVRDGFAKGDILQVVFVSMLFGFGLSSAGPRAKPVVVLLESLTDISQWVQPASVASLILWLAGESGNDVTGAAIPVCGAGL
jgi:Na+/H+-dicarboxylate symporter